MAICKDCKVNNAVVLRKGSEYCSDCYVKGTLNDHAKTKCRACKVNDGVLLSFGAGLVHCRDCSTRLDALSTEQGKIEYIRDAAAVFGGLVSANIDNYGQVLYISDHISPFGMSVVTRKNPFWDKDACEAAQIVADCFLYASDPVKTQLVARLRQFKQYEMAEAMCHKKALEEEKGKDEATMQPSRPINLRITDKKFSLFSREDNSVTIAWEPGPVTSKYFAPTVYYIETKLAEVASASWVRQGQATRTEYTLHGELVTQPFMVRVVAANRAGSSLRAQLDHVIDNYRLNTSSLTATTPADKKVVAPSNSFGSFGGNKGGDNSSGSFNFGDGGMSNSSLLGISSLASTPRSWGQGLIATQDKNNELPRRPCIADGTPTGGSAFNLFSGFGSTTTSAQKHGPAAQALLDDVQKLSAQQLVNRSNNTALTALEKKEMIKKFSEKIQQDLKTLEDGLGVFKNPAGPENFSFN